MQNETYQLLGNRLLVRIKQSEEKVGQVFLPDVAKKPQLRGIIVAVGKGKPNKDGVLEPLQFSVGQDILLGHLHGAKININNEELLLVNADEVVAILGNQG